MSISQKIDLLNTKLDALLPSGSVVSPSMPSAPTIPTPGTLQTVKLFYFNQAADEKLPALDRVNISSIMPVERTVTVESTNLKDLVTAAITELLKGSLTTQDTDAGFISNFPNSDFKLLDVSVDEEGTVTLEFSEVPGFTSGGAAAMGIMSEMIKKTAGQFAGIKGVQFEPDTLFQP
jgi:hypothetical protein